MAVCTTSSQSGLRRAQIFALQESQEFRVPTCHLPVDDKDLQSRRLACCAVCPLQHDVLRLQISVWEERPMVMRRRRDECTQEVNVWLLLA
jgi:hypothetical protein